MYCKPSAPSRRCLRPLSPPPTTKTTETASSHQLYPRPMRPLPPGVASSVATAPHVPANELATLSLSDAPSSPLPQSVPPRGCTPPQYRTHATSGFQNSLAWPSLSVLPRPIPRQSPQSSLPLNLHRPIPLRAPRARAHAARAHSQIPCIPPLPPTPSEVSSFDGWRHDDDAYWPDFRGREVTFRTKSCHKQEDLEPPTQPLDGHGKAVTCAAAVQDDHDREMWVPTSEEEEMRLRSPTPESDPSFCKGGVREAVEGEMHTTLVPTETQVDAGEEKDVNK
ncbi:unnamed protein product [Chondrus crispus]|uniref:Uncharacterized protein n=1 Tax=Chondrus crispus TaxID=2769 RepID=R7QL96_CHOCR|nr:unnamed protein product [Chondrus crispus]CDF38859.1 unnamed protein product [Chondrus crispus]|eukprot:XP_005718764.1 unnamed protein product [Chondrus crispus]